MAALDLSPERLRAAREHAGLSQEKAAGRVGVTSNTVANAERGISEPRASVIARLAQLYGVPLESLFENSSDAA